MDGPSIMDAMPTGPYPPRVLVVVPMIFLGKLAVWLQKWEHGCQVQTIRLHVCMSQGQAWIMFVTAKSLPPLLTII